MTLLVCGITTSLPQSYLVVKVRFFAVFASFGCGCTTVALEELFVVRDVIAHNHVWEAQYLWDDQVGMKLVSAALESGYGDKKFKRVIDQVNRKTRQLGINLFPTRICREDARIVLKTAVEFLLFLENEDRRYLYISDQYVKHRDQLVRFVDLAASLGRGSGK